MSPAAHCARHPQSPAVDTCQRCGAFVCGECTHIRDEDVYCPACVPFLDRPPSARPGHALRCAIAAPLLFVAGAFFGRQLGTLSVVLTLAAPVVAFVLAAAFLGREALARARGEVPRRGAVYPLAWAFLGLDFLLGAAAVAVVVASGPAA